MDEDLDNENEVHSEAKHVCIFCFVGAIIGPWEDSELLAT